MAVTTEVTQLEENRVRLDVAVPEGEVQRRVERTIRQIARDLRVPGFRPGKAPPPVVLQRVGREAVMQEMLRDAIADWYSEALEQAEVEPIDDPDLDVPEAPDGGDFQFTATLQLRPRATLGEYRGLEVGKAEPEVPEGALDAELDRLRDQVARLEPVDRPAADGDFVVIDFEGSVDGRPLPGASARDYLVELGGPRLVAGFGEHLVGRSAGETTTFPVAYDAADQRPDLAGKTVEYTATLKRVQAKQLPPLDDELAAQAGGFETLDELKADLFQRLEAAERARTDELFRRTVIDAVVAGATVDVPKVMVDRQIGSVLHNLAHQLPEGVGLEDYLRATGRTLEQAAEEIRPDAEAAVRRELVVEAVADAEGLEVSDEEVEAQVRADAESSGRDPERLLADVRERGAFESVRRDLRLKRAVDLLMESTAPIPIEQAKARQKLWSPTTKEPQVEAPKLWTPDQPSPPISARPPGRPRGGGQSVPPAPGAARR
jgi:trigger factor